MSPQAFIDPEQTLAVERRAHARRGTRGVREHRMRIPAALQDIVDRGVLDQLSYRQRAILATRINSEFERAERKREKRGREFENDMRLFNEGLLTGVMVEPNQFTPENTMIGQRDTRRRGGITAEERRNAMHLLFPKDRRFAPAEE
jgi:hypothetical protein